MSDRMDCEPVPSSVRSARLFVVDRLQAWRCDELVDTVALLTSELATNAVVHTGQPYSVHVARRGPGVRVEVEDRAEALPTPPGLIDLDAPGAMAEDDARLSFSGLSIVERTASAWGAQPVPGDGKIVWFEVMPAPGSGDGRARVSDLSDLRDPAATVGLVGADRGEVAVDQRPEEAPMARHEYMVDDDRVVEERYVERRSGVGRALLILLAIAAVAVLAFFLLGGSADVDSEGDVEVPEVDVDVNAPDVDVSTSEAPPASADAG